MIIVSIAFVSLVINGAVSNHRQPFHRQPMHRQLNSSTAQLIDSVDEFARCQLIDRHFHRQPTGATNTGATFGGS